MRLRRLCLRFWDEWGLSVGDALGFETKRGKRGGMMGEKSIVEVGSLERRAGAWGIRRRESVLGRFGGRAVGLLAMEWDGGIVFLAVDLGAGRLGWPLVKSLGWSALADAMVIEVVGGLVCCASRLSH